MVTYADPDWRYSSAITYRGVVPFVGVGLPTDADEPTDSRWFTVDGDSVYPSFPDLRFEMAFGLGPFDEMLVTTPGVWTDITRWVHAPTGCTISRGQSSEFDQPQPGDCTFTIRDLDRTFDPLNSASPLNGYLLPRTPVRVTATYDGIDYPLFTGYVDGFPQQYTLGDRVTWIAVQASDALSILAGQRWLPARPAICDDATLGRCDAGNRISGTDPYLPEARSGRRVADLFDMIGLPAALAQVDDGQSVVMGGTPGTDSIWGHILDVVATEYGNIYCTGEGQVVFRERSYVAAEPAALWLDAPGWAITYQALQIDPYALQDIRNEVTRSNGQFTAVTAKDPVSAERYGTVTDERTDLLFATPGDAKDQAAYLLERFHAPVTRIRELTTKPQRWPQYLWPGVLAWDLGTRFAVGRTPLHTGEAFVQTVAVVRITHTFSSTDWTTTYTLVQPDLNSYARCDADTDLDGTSRIAY